MKQLNAQHPSMANHRLKVFCNKKKVKNIINFEAYSETPLMWAKYRGAMWVGFICGTENIF